MHQRVLYDLAAVVSLLLQDLEKKVFSWSSPTETGLILFKLITRSLGIPVNWC